MKQSAFTEEYFRFCENVYRHEDHHNIIVLANHNFKRDIHNDESLQKNFRMVSDSEKGIANMIYDHQIIFTPDVERYEFVNCGYDNNVEKSLKPFLNKERNRITNNTFNGTDS
ncbi:hypothetical protein IBT50_25325 [Bacillus sp. S70]|uniref:hypothetical protein n=1 Tax=unclassified Bacillus (in: firmicutes) TaxID=185979 RepID=UPI00190928A9|nr:MULTISPECIES: hypothetical protein [unclassified Bacillus (in: firmicutes)]MBJ9983570.1 hypothetical protein [Bacillus sp. S29]MBK0104684.1 hypothetical protein [Bacillus sp. S70]MBK0110030.1 hypothetical protein [Bacillus sp. S73]MBK0138811.1 hypothetical protein [Bacillus sp. S72]MBK0148001.1 hypothetical protein [Bacillus sp. S74]